MLQWSRCVEVSGSVGLWRFGGGFLSSWEEKGGTVVLTGVLIMSFVDVKDLREALSDIQHCLVYVFSIYEWKCVTSFTRQLSWCKYTYHVIRDLLY